MVAPVIGCINKGVINSRYNFFLLNILIPNVVEKNILILVEEKKI
jgi:hypothetical protein